MRLMQANNIVNGKSYSYQTPVKEGKVWVVWYYGIIGDDKPIKEKDLNKMPSTIGMIPVDENGETEQ